AIIETGGKQFKVAECSLIKIEKLNKEAGDKIEFIPLLIENDSVISDPKILNQCKVQGSVVKNGLHKKIDVFFYRNKTNEHRRLGHRQPFTEIKIEKIIGG
ncbi:MAG: 50S ribosomal protein L21, partial [Caldisericia bacterium]|nr:50S ribosomal protein L21 [Caldisericia bacterium]